MYKRGRKEQQISMDPFMNIPKSVVENLRKSWAEDFYNDIFLSKNEDRFSVLYSSQYSRPNKPVNILKLAEVNQLDKSMARMDSFMYSSSCKKLTRLELVYKVVQNMIKGLAKLDVNFVLEGFQDYLKEEHLNQTLYHTNSLEAGLSN